jgi:hypothetical protein
MADDDCTLRVMSPARVTFRLGGGKGVVVFDVAVIFIVGRVSQTRFGLLGEQSLQHPLPPAEDMKIAIFTITTQSRIP